MTCSLAVSGNDIPLAFSLSAYVASPLGQLHSLPVAFLGRCSIFLISLKYWSPCYSFTFTASCVLVLGGSCRDLWPKTLLPMVWSLRPPWFCNSWILYHMNDAKVACWLVNTADPFDGGCNSAENLNSWTQVNISYITLCEHSTPNSPYSKESLSKWVYNFMS